MSPRAHPVVFSLRTVSLALALALCWLGLVHQVAAQEQLTLSGTLVNGTAGVAFVPESLFITLHIFDGPVELETRTAQPAFDGGFQFAAVPSAPGRTYFLAADYQGAGYSVVLTEGQLTKPVTLTVYEATTDTTALTVTSHTLIVTGADPNQRVAEVLERVALANTTDRTFVADSAAEGMPQLLRFALPSNAYNLDVRSSLVGGDVLQVDRGFALTTPVPPSGTTPHQFEFIYRVPYAVSALDMSRTVRFGTGNYQVVVPGEVATVRSPQLADLGTVTIEGRNLRLLEGSGFAPDTVLELYLSGLPQPSLLSRLGNESARWYVAGGVPGLIGLGLAAALTYALFQQRRTRPALEPLDSPADRQALMQKIIELDAAYAAHSLSRKRYQAQRQDLKARLIDLELQQRLTGLPLPDNRL